MFPVWAQIKHRKYHLMRSFWKPVNSGKEVKFIFNFTFFFTTNDIIWGIEESFFFFNIIELACWFVQFFMSHLYIHLGTSVYSELYLSEMNV